MPTSTRPRSGRRSPTASTTKCCATSPRRFATAARRPACSTPTVRSTRTSPAASCTSRSWPSRRRPGCIARCSSRQRAMDALGIDYMVVFPTPMLSLGMHPQVDAEVALGNAYNRWLIEQILPQDTAPEGAALSAVQRSRRLRGDGRALRRRAGRGRLLRHLDAPQAGLAQFLHAALRRAAGGSASRSASTPASPGATPPSRSSTASSACTRCRSRTST